MPKKAPLIAPSILSADFARLGEEIGAIDRAGADWIHIDVMDGHFVPNLTLGAPIVKKLRPVTDKFFDCHLMIENPERYVGDFAAAGADLITVHVEACPHLHRNLQQIKALSHHGGGRVQTGVSLNPSTPAEAVFPVLPLCDLVLVMSVNPGFGGQAFIPLVEPKVRALRAQIDRLGLPTRIQIDGGVDERNAAMVAGWGVDTIVAGSGVFNNARHPRYEDAISAIRAAAAGSTPA